MGVIWGRVSLLFFKRTHAAVSWRVSPGGDPPLCPLIALLVLEADHAVHQATAFSLSWVISSSRSSAVSTSTRSSSSAISTAKRRKSRCRPSWLAFHSTCSQPALSSLRYLASVRACSASRRAPSATRSGSIGHDRPALVALRHPAEHNREQDALGGVAVRPVAPVDCDGPEQVGRRPVGPNAFRHHVEQAQRGGMMRFVLAAEREVGRALTPAALRRPPASTASALSAARTSARISGLSFATVASAITWACATSQAGGSPAGCGGGQIRSTSSSGNARTPESGNSTPAAGLMAPLSSAAIASAKFSTRCPSGDSQNSSWRVNPALYRRDSGLSVVAVISVTSLTSRGPSATTARAARRPARRYCPVNSPSTICRTMARSSSSGRRGRNRTAAIRGSERLWNGIRITKVMRRSGSGWEAARPPATPRSRSASRSSRTGGGDGLSDLGGDVSRALGLGLNRTGSPWPGDIAQNCYR